MPGMRPFVYDSSQFRTHLQKSPHAQGEVAFLLSICEPGMTALDVGANRGVTAVTLAKAVGQSGHVWAFEPVPEHYAALKANLSRNGAANAEAFRVALADAPGEVDFYVHGEGSGIVPAEGAQRLKVAATTIDSFRRDRGIRRVDLISSDCEGSELLALRGAERTLMADSPQIFCEVHHGYLDALGQSAADVVAYLTQLGFQVRPISVEHLDTDVGLDACSHIYAARQTARDVAFDRSERNASQTRAPQDRVQAS